MRFEHGDQLLGLVTVQLGAGLAGRVLRGKLAQSGDLVAQVRDQVVGGCIACQPRERTRGSASICRLAVSGFRWAVYRCHAGWGSAAGLRVLSLAVLVFAFTAPPSAPGAAATAGVSGTAVNSHSKQLKDR
ncbi:hypothetical protein [Mycobacteroides abscessus]|uniref:hypothetical protein n=1 Tax=Mycobacteroides abscessus TaxID=36809 RepID=UPI000C262547|nr:hypothetical protein [Mycobacteroides abscessus]